MIQQFGFEKLGLDGAYRITPFYAQDSRGGLIKDYNVNVYRQNGIDHELKETFYTLSHKGVIRAIHIQAGKQQAKLIRCVYGHVYDVIVDLRPNSDTFGKWMSFDLTAENMACIYVPAFFGHGYLVLKESIVSYQCGEVFYEEGDSGIAWNDPSLRIEWPLDRIGGEHNLIISEKDQTLMSFKAYRRQFYEWK